MLKYLKKLLAAGDEASMKRFIVLIISLHFMLTAFLVLLGLIHTTVDRELLKLILETDQIVILVGIGAITAANVGQVFMAKFTGGKGGQSDYTAPPFMPPGLDDPLKQNDGT